MVQREKPAYGKIANDMFFVQFTWTLFALIVALVIHLVQIGIAFKYNYQFDDFFKDLYYTANIYMFVIGIISVSVLFPIFIGHGMTRKDFFKGAVISSVALSLVISILFGLITGLEYGIDKIFDLPLQADSTAGIHFTSGREKNIIAILILTIVEAPFGSISSNWIMALFIFALNLLTYNVIGSMIGSAFYRFHALAGIGFILLALVFLTIRNFFWGYEGGLFISWLPAASPVHIPLLASIAITILLIGIVMWLIRLLTRKVPIKM